MTDKIEAGRELAAQMLKGEDITAMAEAQLLAFELALISAQGAFQLPPAVFEKMVGNLAASKSALRTVRRHQRHIHVDILRRRADEDMTEVPFGCDRSCFPSMGANPGEIVLTDVIGGVPVSTWHPSSDSSSSSSPPAFTPSGVAARPSGLQA